MHAVPGYHLEELLAGGGSGQVWRARSRATGAPVAVKLIPAARPDERGAVLAEAAFLRGLDHPHLVRLHEVVPAGADLALVLDLAAGGSLAALLSARGRLTPGEVVTALAPVGAALACAHAAGVVHGDVSPGNVLFTPAGFPLLADLGLARLLGDPAPGAPGRCTPAYADPLAAAGDVPIPASDVFSLAAVAFHALTGNPVWAGETVDDVLAGAAAGRAGDVRAALAAAGVPGATADIVAAGLAVDPAKRPTAAEFALDLRCSTEPIAVELDAGRARRIGVLPRAAFTQGVRLPLPDLRGPRRRPLRIAGRRAARTRHDGRHRRTGRARGPRVALPLGAALIGLGAGAAVLFGLRSSPAAPTPGPPPGEAAGSPVAADDTGPAVHLDATAVLVALDVRRERAFATRDPGLLRGVYADAGLLAADVATLQRAVPAGCVLVGVRNHYQDVRAGTGSGGRLQVRAEVGLQPSQLRCGDAAPRAVAGAPARPMVLTLAPAAAGYRLAAISPAPAPARTGRPPGAP